MGSKMAAEFIVDNYVVMHIGRNNFELGSKLINYNHYGKRLVLEAIQ